MLQQIKLLVPTSLPEGLHYIQRSMAELETAQTGKQEVSIEYCRTADLDLN